MCIFCSIVHHEIPSKCIYEDDEVMAFFDISQTTKGHTLVIPKQHFDNFLTCDPNTMKHVMEVAQMLAKKLCVTLHANGMNILSNVNEVAGQSVMHFHVHLIPRYQDDEGAQITFLENPNAGEDIEEAYKLLIKQ